jgi:outer membrane protein
MIMLTKSARRTRFPAKRRRVILRSSFVRSAVSMVLLTACVQLCPGKLTNVRAQGQPSWQTPSDGLTLSGAIDIALRSNPLIKVTSSGRELADAQLSEARAGRFPLLQLGHSFARSNNPVFVFGSLLEQGRFGPQNFDPQFLNNPDSLSNFRSSITFRLPLFDQKQSDARISQARIGQQQADSQTESVAQQIRFEVLRAYYGVLVAQGKKEVADEAVKSSAADVKRIYDLVDAGVVVQSDSLSAEVQLAEFRQQQIQAEGDLVIAQAALNTVLGVAVDTPQKVTGQLAKKTFNIETQAELIRFALAARADLARAGLSLKSGKERMRGVRGEYLPRVDAFGTYGVSARNLANGSSDYTVGASVTFNLFDAGRSARLKQARAAETASAAEVENLASQIRLEVVRAYQQYVSARERVSVAARAVDQANEARRIVQDRYHAGLTTITEVLRAETTYVRTRVNLLAARYEHYIGYANVLLATGRLTTVDDFVS